MPPTSKYLLSPDTPLWLLDALYMMIHELALAILATNFLQPTITFYTLELYYHLFLNAPFFFISIAYSMDHVVIPP